MTIALVDAARSALADLKIPARLLGVENWDLEVAGTVALPGVRVELYMGDLDSEEMGIRCTAVRERLQGIEGLRVEGWPRMSSMAWYCTAPPE